jgi:two-component system, response regulator FlrC
VSAALELSPSHPTAHSGHAFAVSGQALPCDGSDPDPSGADDAVRDLVGRTLGEVERRLILGTLSRCVGNRTHAAKLLGISIRTLRNKLHEYAEAGIAVPRANPTQAGSSRGF